MLCWSRTSEMLTCTCSSRPAMLNRLPPYSGIKLSTRVTRDNCIAVQDSIRRSHRFDALLQDLPNFIQRKVLDRSIPCNNIVVGVGKLIGDQVLLYVANRGMAMPLARVDYCGRIAIDGVDL